MARICSVQISERNKCWFFFFLKSIMYFPCLRDCFILGTIKLQCFSCLVVTCCLFIAALGSITFIFAVYYYKNVIKSQLKYQSKILVIPLIWSINNCSTSKVIPTLLCSKVSCKQVIFFKLLIFVKINLDNFPSSSNISEYYLCQFLIYWSWSHFLKSISWLGKFDKVVFLVTDTWVWHHSDVWNCK